jgi:phospholipid transport system substrate-binding protein
MSLVSQPVYDASTPDGLVKAVVFDVMNTLNGDASIRGDRKKVIALMDQKIWPYVDFQHTTRLCVGGSWVTATQDQRNHIVEQFKKLLTDKYAEDLAQMRDQRVDYKPSRMAPDATDVVVESRMLDNRQPVSVAYRVAKTANGWRIYDLSTREIWMVVTYQRLFAEQMSRNGINGLIGFLRG